MTCRREQVEEGEVGVDVDVIGHCFWMPIISAVAELFQFARAIPLRQHRISLGGWSFGWSLDVSVLPPDHYVGAWLVCLASPHLSLCELQSRILRQSVHTVFLVVLFTACLSGSTRDMRVPC